MIPIAEWSRAKRSAAVPSVRTEPIAEAPKPLFAAETVETVNEGLEDYDDLILLLALALQEAARFSENLRLADAVQSAQADLAIKLTKTVLDAASEHGRSIGDWVKSLLRPWIGGRIEEASVASFVDEVMIAFRRKLSSTVVVAAPEGLREELRAQFAKLGLEVAIHESPDGELSATQGGTEVTTRISLWQEKLASLLA